MCWQALPATTLELPPLDNQLVGQPATDVVREGETLGEVARRNNIGHVEIRLANPGLDFWLPPVGARVDIPGVHILPDAARRGIVLNVPEMRLYYFPSGPKGEPPDRVVTHPVSIGRQDWQTPLGETRVVARVRSPAWVPPESIHKEAVERGRPLPAVVPPGPDNPLGDHALRLAVPGYLIHGTNRPAGVGMRVTHGCIRLYPEDIETLFESVSVGTPVTIVNQPVKLGWMADLLYIEVHPPLEEDALDADALRNLALEQLERIERDGRPVRLSGRALSRALHERSGMPVLISLEPDVTHGP